ncbi:MAG TPA: hypothetical protein VG757_17110 [Devosia sp.]|nr:hypothetical protein [Devosia sp.]
MQGDTRNSTANEGFGLTTAQIIYRMPDHLDLLQEYLWQRYDTFPDFPLLTAFLDFWQLKLDGPIHKVTVAHARLLMPSDFMALRRARH